MDDQIATASERAAIAEADTWLRDNRPIPHEVVLAEMGLTMSDWEKLAAEPDAAA
jgi:hypothetical protein